MEKVKKKTKNCAEWWNRKDGVQEVEETGLVNKHIYWRSLEVPEEMGWKCRDMNS